MELRYQFPDGCVRRGNGLCIREQHVGAISRQRVSTDPDTPGTSIRFHGIGCLSLHDAVRMLRPGITMIIRRPNKLSR